MFWFRHLSEDTGCCPRFDPEPWDGRELTLQDRLFVRDSVWAFLHLPLDTWRVMSRDIARIRQAGALPSDPLVLCEERSLWRTDVYIAVSKEVPGTEMVRIPGNFLSKAFEGPYGDLGKWVASMKKYVRSRGGEVKKVYFYYTTCPDCARIHGKNYVVILAMI